MLDSIGASLSLESMSGIAEAKESQTLKGVYTQKSKKKKRFFS